VGAVLRRGGAAAARRAAQQGARGGGRFRQGMRRDGSEPSPGGRTNRQRAAQHCKCTFRARQVYTLAEFAAKHEAWRAQCAARLAAARAEALRAVEGACAASLEALELQLQSFGIKQARTLWGGLMTSAAACRAWQQEKMRPESCPHRPSKKTIPCPPNPRCRLGPAAAARRAPQRRRPAPLRPHAAAAGWRRWGSASCSWSQAAWAARACGAPRRWRRRSRTAARLGAAAAAAGRTRCRNRWGPGGAAAPASWLW
jgi:hypothetical protein